ncbi:type III-A CRISPR-associated RAMP protein Csm4 [Methanocaldococcus sp.]
MEVIENIKLVELKPKINSKYHFGEGSLEHSGYIFHSNSLFSAIFNNYVKLYGKNDKNLEELKNIKISSLFLKIDGNNEDIYLIPKPEHPYFYILKENIKGITPKDVKKIQFFSVKAYIDYLNGKIKWEGENLKEIINNQTINKKIVISKDEIDEIKKVFNITENSLKDVKIKLISSILEQKVAIDRIKNISLQIDNRGQLYTVEFIKLHKNISYYFLIDYNSDDEEFINKLEASIRLIADEGLGGERSSGAGFFESVKISELNNDFKNLFKMSDNLGYKTTLGIAIPNKNNYDKIIYYKFMEFGGYIYSPYSFSYPKKRVLALTEGSIVKSDFKGCVLDNIAPENFKCHNVYLHGKPILIPFKGDYNDSKV